MIEVPRARITAITGARTVRELQPHLQEALELEMAVIPLYLTALFSLSARTNGVIRELARAALVDEMLHIALIANILNAMRCPPALCASRLPRGYPACLPLDASGAAFGLKKFSADMARDFFMAFESAGRQDASHPVAEDHGTLGQFYGTLIAKIEELGDAGFIGDPARQFVDAVSYSERELFRVHDAASAVHALRLISGQGPDRGRGAARWQRSSQIRSNTLPDAAAFDPAGVINIVENSRASMYQPGSAARRMVDAFNEAYGNVLTALNETFKGKPERYELAVAGMYRLTSLARSIVAIDLGNGTFAAPSFECCKQSEAQMPASEV
jgi:hypothetical protein